MAKISCKQSKFECCQYLSLFMGFYNFGFCWGRYFVLSLSSHLKTSATYTLRCYVSESKAASGYEFLQKRCSSVAKSCSESSLLRAVLQNRCFKKCFSLEIWGVKDSTGKIGRSAKNMSLWLEYRAVLDFNREDKLRALVQN